MDGLVLTSYAKINLALNVLEKRPEDGYHYVDMVMLPVTLADTVRMEPAADVTVTCTPALEVPPEANLAYKAARLLQKASGHTGGAAIQIEKAIPVAGGMAGGSTNAAAVLRGLNELWGAGFSEDDLEALAMQLGSDVPFFIRQRTARVQGVGERLMPLAVGARLWFVVATPAVAKSTGNVYRLFDELERVDRPDVGAMAAAVAAGDVAAIAAALGNVFEQVMLPRHPEIAELKAEMMRCGAAGALMSGAGPTVFGLVPDREDGLRLKDRLGNLGHRALLVSSAG